MVGIGTILAFGSFLLGATGSYLWMVRPSSPEQQNGGTAEQEEENREIAIQAPENPDVDGIMIAPNRAPQSDPEDTRVRAEAPPPDDQRELLRLLKGNERKIIETLIDHGEMNQTELSERTGIPRSTLSRTLSGLEARGLVYRYENGMSKMVKLEKKAL